MSRIKKIRNFTKVKKLFIPMVLVLGLGLFLMVSVFPKNDLQMTNDEIPVHDGDILVDSLNISSDSGENAAKTEESSTKMVVSDDISDKENTDTYFEELRATITMDRNQIISMLTDVISETENGQEKDNATAKKLKLIEYMDKEKNIENLLITKGLPSTLVLLTDNAVNVTVDKQELTQSEVAKIYDIIMRETGRKASDIVIQSKY